MSEDLEKLAEEVVASQPKELPDDWAPKLAESFCQAAEQETSIQLQSDIPVMKRYAHHGKRRRAYTEEMFRCQLTDMISRTPLVCGHLLWKNKPDELRNHLAEHMNVEDVAKLTDSQVLERYTPAKKIFLEGVTDDETEENEEDE